MAFFLCVVGLYIDRPEHSTLVGMASISAATVAACYGWSRPPKLWQLVTTLVLVPVGALWESNNESVAEDVVAHALFDGNILGSIGLLAGIALGIFTFALLIKTSRVAAK